MKPQRTGASRLRGLTAVAYVGWGLVLLAIGLPFSLDLSIRWGLRYDALLATTIGAAMLGCGIHLLRSRR